MTGFGGLFLNTLAFVAFHNKIQNNWQPTTSEQVNLLCSQLRTSEFARNVGARIRAEQSGTGQVALQEEMGMRFWCRVAQREGLIKMNPLLAQIDSARENILSLAPKKVLD